MGSKAGEAGVRGQHSGSWMVRKSMEMRVAQEYVRSVRVSQTRIRPHQGRETVRILRV